MALAGAALSERCRVLVMAHDLGMYGRRWVAEPPVPGQTPRSGYVWINAAEAFTCYSGNVPLSPLDQQKVRYRHSTPRYMLSKQPPSRTKS